MMEQNVSERNRKREAQEREKRGRGKKVLAFLFSL